MDRGSTHNGSDALKVEQYLVACAHWQHATNTSRLTEICRELDPIIVKRCGVSKVEFA
jgi:hypothetical protein